MTTELATLDNVIDLAAVSTEGKNFDFGELELPRLQLIRPNSRQLKKGEADYNKDAKQGMFYNSLTKEVYDPDESELLFIPVNYKQLIALLTIPTIPGQQGDYVATVGPNDVQLQYNPEVKKTLVVAGINVKGPDGEEINSAGLAADARDSFSGIIVFKGRPQPVILTLKGKSKQVAGKKLKSMIAMQKEAIYAHAYKLNAGFTTSVNGDILVEEFKYGKPTAELDNVAAILPLIEMLRGK